ncbi:IclR family transcriptional regulator [Endozoicomonas elysicola]|uniref:Transcriptional regulator n=1 Tax=Endozoicomonas elysicola TaxID=305900 RepID=A0A081KGY1_9GAMM|nr:IclR family transcriptional regulator C-terminal domain-containing protein [Endozoicomonas elysicola]KEI73407.1 hypothetical protein GV64_24165 [Endozoicomonas elysicola]
MSAQNKDSLESSKPIIGIYRAFSLIERLADKPSSGVTELALATGMSKTMVFRMLQTLQEIGIVKKQQDDQYKLSMKLFSLGSLALEKVDLPRIADPWMQKLADFCRETVHLGVQEGNQVVYLHKINARHNLQMFTRVGQVAPVHSTAMGKVMLMHHSEEKVLEILGEGPYQAFTDKTILEYPDYLKALEKTRQQGFGIDNEENEDGVRCMSVPVRNHLNQIVAAMSVSIPIFRHTSDRDQELLDEMKLIAAQISKELGNTPPKAQIEW